METEILLQIIEVIEQAEQYCNDVSDSVKEDIIDDMCILDHIEKIIEISKEFGIDECFAKGKGHFDYVTAKLGISHLQAVLFSHFIEKSYNNYISINDMAENIKCSQVRIIKYLDECEELEKKRLIRFRNGKRSRHRSWNYRNNNGISFWIHRDVLDSLRKFNEFRPKKIENLSIYEFFTVIDELFDEREQDDLNVGALTIELLNLISLNMHLLFCKKIMNYSFDEDILILLIYFCHSSGNNSDDRIRIYDIEFLYEDKSKIRDIERMLTGGYHPLMESKLIDFNNDDIFAKSDAWKLSDRAKKELLSELDSKRNRNYKKNLTLYDSIKPKKMFYNPKETGEIQQLTSLLQEENYRKIQDRLELKGMRKGFACLFSGGAGTGKTETAYQIARETKRHVMMVDIAQTKSMWYGESEKQIKAIFDNYRSIVENSEIAPILLFNEADAVIGKRKEFNDSNRAIDQTENTIQNIILQEMENLSGILIATTNLLQNMDKAFERRFLYKITFDKPGIESRKGIWTSLLMDLPEDKAEELSAKFELSGGQIENVFRKINVDAILNGENLSMDTLFRYCEDEIKNGFNFAKRMGFIS
ncbi:MAG: ATP-binding protein [Spirochaetes bacterium]|nr:ATP-binding protein [Spirochaetota bacterium]